MKNILIPTTLQQDTLLSVKTAIKQAAGTSSIITLMIVADAPEAESAFYFLRNTRFIATTSQNEVLENCREEILKTNNCTLEIHNRYGLSSPLLKNLLEHLGTNLIIIPPSYKQQRENIHHYCLSLLANSKIAILHLTEDCQEQEFNKALYLEHATAQLGLQELQQLVSSQFNFKIVSHATVDRHHSDGLGSQITEAISKNNIDLLIETRKTEKIRTRKHKAAAVNVSLGLPVLSIFEKA